MKQEAKRPREEPGIPVAGVNQGAEGDTMPFSTAYSKEGMKVVLKLAPGVEELPKDELTLLDAFLRVDITRPVSRSCSLCCLTLQYSNPEP